MAGTDDVEGTRLPGRTPDRVPEAADDEIDAVNRLMGFLRDDEE